MRIFVLALSFGIAVLAVLFTVQNTQTVAVQFFGLTSGNVPLALVVLISIIAGALLTWLLGLWGAVQRGLRSRRTAAEHKRLVQRERDLSERLAVFEQQHSSVQPATAQTATVERTLATETSKQ